MAVPRPVDIGSLSRRLDGIARQIDAVDASRRLSFAGTVRQATATPSVSPGWSTLATATFPVPDWCYRALVLTMATVRAYADLFDFTATMQARIAVDGQAGDVVTAITGGVASEAMHVALVGRTADVPDPGPTLTVAVQVTADGDLPWPADSRNDATVNAMVLFLR